MRIALLFFAGLCAFVAAVPTITHSYSYPTGGKFKITDKVFLHKQHDVLMLFHHFNQDSYFKEHLEIYKSWSIENNVEAFTNPQVVKHFLQYYQHGMLPKGEIFSVFYQDHLEQAIALFKLFYYAKDYETFYKTAVWAHYNMNEGMFLYAYSVAVIHRPDTYGIVLPPIYEVYPYYFVSSDIIYKAQAYKQKYHEEQVHTGGYPGYTFYGNYTRDITYDPEQTLTYFTGDVGLNAYYYSYNLYYPFWMSGDEFKLKFDRRGEQFFFVYKQLLARYYLERLSNDFGEISTFDLEAPFEHGFYPLMTYPNGVPFPGRSNYVSFFKDYYNYGHSFTYKRNYAYTYDFVKTYERRISDAVDLGYVYSHDGKKIDLYEPHGVNILGNMIESNPDSPNTKYYGPWLNYGRHLFGYSHHPTHKYSIVPSALEHFETSLHDPAFWMFYKNVLSYFWQYKHFLPSYSYTELYYPGVKVESFEVDRLFTFFDYFDYSLNNAVYFNAKEYEKNDFHIRVRYPRLNHKPFTYKFSVNSEKATEAVARVFIGPKYDEYGHTFDINANRVNFVQFDQFVVSLEAGKNAIERSSTESFFFVKDRTSFYQLYKQVMGALDGEHDFTVYGSESYFGIPNRLLLPKGKHGGQTFQFYVIFSPYKATTHQQQQYGEDYYYYPRVGTGIQYMDSYALGYPFDRTIDEYSFFVPNSYFKDVEIFHKTVEELNVTPHTYEY